MNHESLRIYQQPHARQLLDALRRNRSALDASDTGTGKTYVACALAREFGCVPLVIAPKAVLPSWEEAARKMGIQIESVNYEKARGRATWQNPRAQTLYGQEVPAGSGSAWRWKEPVELAIFDEAQRCGGSTSLASKMLIAARRQFGHVLLLSATAASKPQQFKALGFALGLFDLNNFTWWLLAHGCYPGTFGGFEFTSDPEEQLEAMQKIHRQIFPDRGARLRKAHIPNFPLTQVSVRLIEDMSGKAKGLADELSFAYAELHEAEKRAKHPLTRLLRARQALELLKVDDLADLAQIYAQTSKVAIFVNFSQTVDALEKKLSRLFGKKQVGVYDGRNLAEREQVLRAFQRNRLSVLILNCQAGGTGISLHDPLFQVERTSLISPSPSADIVRQILGRPQRDGGGFSQQFFVYFSKSREARIAARLEQKLENLDALNDGELNGLL